MSSNPDNLAATKTTGKILFTGSAVRVIDDLIRHTAEAYQAQTCDVIDTSFHYAIKSFRPHTVVVCLSDESSGLFSMLLSLAEKPEYVNLPIIAIGNEEDCNLFKQNVSHKISQVFTRPLNMKLFIETLDEYVNGRIAEVQAMQEMHAQAEAEAVAEAEAETEAVAEAAAEAEAEAEAETEKVQTEPVNTQPLQTESAAPTIVVSNKKTILVVDDDVGMLNMIKLCLEELYDVAVVPSGKLASAYLKKKAADLVLLDYIMPEEDGPAVLRQIRTSSSQPNIPVVFLTGVAEKDMVMRGLELRPNGYLLKPVTKNTLLKKIKEILAGS